MADQPSQSIIAQKLQVLFSGGGYNFYSKTTNARADDQLVRQRASSSLTAASQHLAAVEAEFRRRYMPASTRENPYPPADVMEAFRSIGRVRTRIGGIDSLVRGMSVPTQDKVWWRFRSEPTLLDTLLTFDYNLVIDSERLVETAQSTTADSCRTTPAEEHFITALSEIEKLIAERGQFLLTPLPY